jgi:hypothetical protein
VGLRCGVHSTGARPVAGRPCRRTKRRAAFRKPAGLPRDTLPPAPSPVRRATPVPVRTGADRARLATVDGLWPWSGGRRADPGRALAKARPRISPQTGLRSSSELGWFLGLLFVRKAPAPADAPSGKAQQPTGDWRLRSPGGTFRARRAAAGNGPVTVSFSHCRRREGWLAAAAIGRRSLPPIPQPHDIAIPPAGRVRRSTGGGRGAPA